MAYFQGDTKPILPEYEKIGLFRQYMATTIGKILSLWHNFLVDSLSITRTFNIVLYPNS